MEKHFSGPVTVFHGQTLPEKATPVGYAALIYAYKLAVPLPYRLSAVSEQHKMMEKDNWRFFTPRHAPGHTLEGHLKFALKYEGLDLAVLNRLFFKIIPDEIEEAIRKTPTGSYLRRIWFLYEWLTGKMLDLPDLDTGNYVSVINTEMQFAVKGESVRRQRVVNNLPGTHSFCPLVFRSKKLEDFISMDLKRRAHTVIDRIPRDIMSRAAAFLLLKDSKASYAIEDESSSGKRIERWGQIIGEAGNVSLSRDELIRLQKIVIGDARFVSTGLRSEGGFIGEHDRETGVPLPEHISANSSDLVSLVDGLLSYIRDSVGEIDPVITAAVIAFGFIYIHPFADGNGRIHRYIIHHVLAENGYNPAGMVFPVSAAILDRIGEYRRVLNGYSTKLLPLIEWEPAHDNNVKVVNKTDDYYRFFDATPHAEFLYSCVMQTIDSDLPLEVEFLQNYDRFRQEIEAIVEMPSKTINLLFRFLKQNKGILSARACSREFKLLHDGEIKKIEEVYKNVFRNNNVTK